MHLTESPAVQSKLARGPLPILIGFTGHRDLVPEDVESIRKSLGGFFVEMQSKYPHTPLALLTGLAEGADSLAAEAALDAGASHIAILPRPMNAYLEDFPVESARQHFQKLLGRSSAVTVAQPDPSVKGYDAQADRIGIWSHGLLTVWDGKEGEGASGTCDTVRLCLDGFASPLVPANRPLDPPETRPVWWLKSRRAKHPQPPVSPTIERLFPGPEDGHERTRKAYDKLLADIDTFNRTSVEGNDGFKAEEATSLDYLLPAPVRATLSPGLVEMISRYARADVMAIALQKRLKQCMDGMLAGIFLAGLFVQLRTWSDLREIVGQTMFSMVRWLPVLFFLIAAGCYLWEKWRKYQTRYLDYRALAEGLRVQIFWSLAGVKTNVADEYLTRYRGEIEWIRRTIRATLLKVGAGPSVTPSTETRSLVRKHWVGDQQAFFTRNAGRQAKMPKAVNNAWKAALVVAFVIGILKMLPPSPGGASARPLIIAGLAVFALGLLKLRVKILALSEQARQYKRMSDVFTRAAAKLDGGADEQLILAELGREALAENADWLLLHRERPLELPKA